METICGVVTRKIALDDVESVAALHETQNERPADRSYIRRCITDFPSSLCLLDHRTVGFAYARSLAPDILLLTNLLVDAPHRGRGLGSWMLADIEQQAALRWSCIVLTNSELLHHPARPSPLPFYAKNGYSILFETDHTSMWIKRIPQAGDLGAGVKT